MERVLSALSTMDVKGILSLRSALNNVLFARFESAYSKYNGNATHRLARADCGEHSCLWDDYVLKHEIYYI